MNEIEREDAMYAGYARSIEVPPMWDAIAARIETRRTSRWRFAAVAAVFAMVVSALVFMPRHVLTPSAGSIAVAHYRDALRPFERRDDPMLNDLRNATRAAEAAAMRAPEDAQAVMRAVAAYDAQLQVMRTVSHE
ncbi:MAG: hypothetical protein M3Q69_13085 [Acidobacteriota bacterium]|nr:hypothetical protein [Acidobacteriota bacterium]